MPENRARYRFLFVKIVTLLFAILIMWEYASIMLFSQDGSRGRPKKPPVIERGPIMDRNGRILAIQTKLYSVSAWIPYISAPDETAELLAPILGVPPEDLKSRFEESRVNYLLLKRKISPNEADRITKLKNEKKLEGISLEPEYGRSYPGKTLASHVVGFTGVDNTGLSGIEYALDSVLSPPPPEDAGDTVYGNQVYLTLDLNIQYFAEKTARRLYEEHEAESVMMLIMKADTGEVLGYASMPDFDPNTFLDSDTSDRRNRPVSFLYEPGSVFKIFSLGSFIQLGGISDSSIFVCDGEYDNPLIDEPIKCLGVHGEVTPELILKYSCNSGAAYASDTVSDDEFYSMLRKFGFGDQTGIELSGEEYGILRRTSQWSARSKPSIAMGQEIAVSAMQVATAATVYANHGMLLKPHLVKRIVSPDGKVVKEYGREAVRKVLDSGSADTILNLMSSAVEASGTAHRAAIDGLTMSIKTGTAQMYDKATGTYSHDKYLASSIAIFPTEDPQLIVYLVIENPKGEYYGGRIAAPVMKEAAEYLIPYLGIPFPGNKVIDHSGKITVSYPDPLAIGDTLPDFTGLPKRSLLPLFEREDLSVEISGDGWVVKQEPAPGTPVTAGMRIRLELE